MVAQFRKRKIPGMALAITKNGRLVYSRGIGWADRERRQPVQPNSLFRIASVSKPITAVAILRLAEQGKLKLDDKAFEIVARHEQLANLGAVHESLQKITVRQLLQHTGGWDRTHNSDPTAQSLAVAKALKIPLPPRHVDIIRYMAPRAADFAPGSRFVYSNFGYCVLGRIVEVASGRPYDEYVRAEVLAPLGIKSMRLGGSLESDRAPGEVKYYDARNVTAIAIVGPRKGKSSPLTYGASNLKALDSCGGWISSAVDLARFAAAFDDPEHCPILSAQSVRTMLAPPAGAVGHEGGGPRRNYYGCGWAVVRDGSGKQTAWHNGDLAAASSLLIHRADGMNLVAADQ